MTFVGCSSGRAGETCSRWRAGPFLTSPVARAVPWQSVAQVGAAADQEELSGQPGGDDLMQGHWSVFTFGAIGGEKAQTVLEAQGVQRRGRSGVGDGAEASGPSTLRGTGAHIGLGGPHRPGGCNQDGREPRMQVPVLRPGARRFSEGDELIVVLSRTCCAGNVPIAGTSTKARGEGCQVLPRPGGLACRARRGAWSKPSVGCFL